VAGVGGEGARSWSKSEAKGEVAAGVGAEGEGEAYQRLCAHSRPEVRERPTTDVPRGDGAARQEAGVDAVAIGDERQGSRRAARQEAGEDTVATRAHGAAGIGGGGAPRGTGREGLDLGRIRFGGKGEGKRWVPRGNVGSHVGEKQMKC
jgi:hypothetical protein